MTVTELLEHPWLNDKTARDIPLDSPSIIIADEVRYIRSLFQKLEKQFPSLTTKISTKEIAKRPRIKKKTTVIRNKEEDGHNMIHLFDV